MSQKKSAPESNSIPPPAKQEEEKKKHWCKLASKTVRIESATVAQDSFTIGRASGNNMQIKDSKISGNHCLVGRNKNEKGEYECFIEDRSTNGTFLNGTKVNSLPLRFIDREEQ